jgi:long-chain acyl-CoA synthetase
MSASASAATVAELVLNRVAATPDAEAFSYPEAGAWKRVTWRQAGDDVRAIASGLRALGLADEDRAAILAGTRLEWILADLGILCAGGAVTTIYPSNTAEECAYILRDSGSAFVFVEDAKQLAKIESKRAELPGLKKAILFDGAPSGGDFAITLAELKERGKKYDAEDAARFERVARAVKKDALATLVYTSGTTGEPKGVELTHDCWVFEAEAIEKLGLLEANDNQFLWLPLSHVFGKVLVAAQLQIGFATAVDGRIDKIVDNLAVVKPTFTLGVPRIFEKVRNRVIQNAEEGGGVKRSIFRWAVAVGMAASAARQRGEQPGAWLKLKVALADKLVYSKIRQRFGGRLKYFVSGSAPLAREVSEFFDAVGVRILEGYGLTESSAASFCNRPAHYKLGTVGQPLPGIEVRIAPADGEILMRGRGIMRGYHGRADATRESLDAEGWLHTGDIGELDGEQFLKITDRKKDLIKTSGGKYVAPQALEGKLKAMCPVVSQVLVHGNNRNFVTALVTLDVDASKSLGDGESKARDVIQQAVNALNAELPSYSTLKKFAIVPEFAVESGELTASLKMKRKVIEQKHKSVLDGFYSKDKA